jgi:hypothetical protein
MSGCFGATKTELIRRIKVCGPENMLVSGSGLCEGSVYIFCPFLWFVSFGQAKEPTDGSSAKPNEQNFS